MNRKHFLVRPGRRARLKDFDPSFTGPYRDKERAEEKLAQDIEEVAKWQDVLYAHDTHAILMIFQAMDAAGKDGAIKHVMSGVNPQGCQVFSFKAPSAEELDHDYLWRSSRSLPERGRIGIFNRSYYEEVLVVRVHPEILRGQKLPPQESGDGLWKDRFQQINAFERYLAQNGIHILKFFLNVSKEEQKRRFLKRIDTPEKNWKFSTSDVRERQHWSEYMKAYEEVFQHTSTRWAPWYVIPADHKWFTRAAVANILLWKLRSLKMSYPSVSKAHLAELKKAKAMLLAEKE
ncbi:MAG: polyphosphate kinase 2 family protein [Bacteroidetes bacterium]|jgi:PPK2 family polyphosphate:nucleotide phosphotransferase|nr:polyphosphate kinase 2 family protein [Bacteroidota bacterium]